MNLSAEVWVEAAKWGVEELLGDPLLLVKVDSLVYEQAQAEWPLCERHTEPVVQVGGAMQDAVASLLGKCGVLLCAATRTKLPEQRRQDTLDLGHVLVGNVEVLGLRLQEHVEAWDAEVEQRSTCLF